LKQFFKKSEITNESPLLADEKQAAKVGEKKEPRRQNYHKILLAKRFAVFLVFLGILIAGVLTRQIRFQNENPYTLAHNVSANSTSVN
jgi:hypothetical protein